MRGHALLVPIPRAQLHATLKMLAEQDFVLLGTAAREIFQETREGARVWIYVSHDTAEPVIRFMGTYRGLVEDELAAHRLRKSGFRLLNGFAGESGCWWKLAGIEKLARPVPLTEMRLVSGECLDGYPRGPIPVVDREEAERS